VTVVLHVAKGNLFLLPGVREDGVFGDVSADKCLKEAGARVDESHDAGVETLTARIEIDDS